MDYNWSIEADKNGKLNITRYGNTLTSGLIIDLDGITVNNTYYWGTILEFTEKSIAGQSTGCSLQDQAFNVEFSSEDGITQNWELLPKEKWVEAKVTITNHSERTRRLRQLYWNTEGITKEKYCDYELFGPGLMPTKNEPYDLHRPIEKYRSRNLISHCHLIPAPFGETGIGGVHNPKNCKTEAVWFFSETFPSVLSGIEKRDRIVYNERIECPRWLRPGESQTIGSFFFSIMSGTRMDASQAFADCIREQSWSKGTDFDTQRCINILEINIGPKLYRTYFNNYLEVADRIDEIQRLGFTFIDIMPAFPNPHYTVNNFMDIAGTYGGPEGLRILIEKAHQAGIKIMFDMVFHGPIDFDDTRCSAYHSFLLEGHDDWFLRNEHGDFQKTYTRSLDLANPEYQQYISDSMMYYLDEWHVDGFRLDAQFWNKFANWDENIDRQPYESLLAGFAMMDIIRKRVKNKYPDTVFYTEGVGPAVGRCHEYEYNYAYHWLYPALCKVVDHRGMADTVMNYGSVNTMCWQDAALWMTEMKLIQPKGLVTVQQVDSHDSSEWTTMVGGQLNRMAFGDACHEVLFAMMALAGGGMMVYWPALEGHEDFDMKVLNARKTLPILFHGECSFTEAISDDPKVALILWKFGDEKALFIGNLSGIKKNVRIRLPEGCMKAEKSVFKDLLAGEVIDKVRIDFEEAALELELDPFAKYLVELSFNIHQKNNNKE